MGRRSLPKVSDQVDLSGHFSDVRADRKPTPPGEIVSVSCAGVPQSLRDWTSHFQNPRAALQIEVGSGKGLFLANAAQARPEVNFLGIELAFKYARFAAARLAIANLPNAFMLCADAHQILRDTVPDASVAQVHIYFPDPWWKKRHRKRRIMNRDFLFEVARVLESGGVLHFWSDVEEYFQESVNLLKTMECYAERSPAPEHDPQHSMDYQTHFERRMRLHDVPVYRSAWVRIS